MSEDTRKNARNKKSRGIGRGTGDLASWRLVNQQLLVDVLDLVSSSGGALRLGYSRDGLVYCIGIYGDGEPYTEWCSSLEECMEVLVKIQILFTDIWNDQVVAANGKKK